MMLDYNSFLKKTSREMASGVMVSPPDRSPRSDGPFNHLIEEVVECYYEKKRLVKALKKQCDYYNEKTKQLMCFANKEDLERLQKMLQ